MARAERSAIEMDKYNTIQYGRLLGMHVELDEC